MRTSRIPAGQYVPTADQRVFFWNVPWSAFERQLDIRGEGTGPRISYLCGSLEIMSPSKSHERISSFIGHLLMAFALERGLELSPYGSWTLKSEPDRAGAEPDECFIVGADQEKATPDLAIEVVWTSGGLDKLEIYKHLRIREVWQWAEGKIQLFALREGRYARIRRSTLFPELDLELLTSFLDHPTATQAVRAYRAALAAPARPARKRGR